MALPLWIEKWTFLALRSGLGPWSKVTTEAPYEADGYELPAHFEQTTRDEKLASLPENRSICVGQG